MICTLICKKREAEDGRKWVNFSMLRGKKWYNVKFVKECAPPQVQKIAEGVGRAFIDLTPDDKYDIREQGSNATLFVESYKNLSEDALKKCVADEIAKVEKYRADHEKARVDFLTPVDDAELPF